MEGNTPSSIKKGKLILNVRKNEQYFGKAFLASIQNAIVLLELYGYL